MLEWKLKDVLILDEHDFCLCGHYPISEQCILRNDKTKTEVAVGNCCVKKFLGLPTDLIFRAMKRVAKDHTKSLNQTAVDHAFTRQWINEWEKAFYEDTYRKRSLSPKQSAKRRQINEKILSCLKSSKK